jgi:hypothetical protein
MTLVSIKTRGSIEGIGLLALGNVTEGLGVIDVAISIVSFIRHAKRESMDKRLIIVDVATIIIAVNGSNKGVPIRVHIRSEQ